MPNLIDVIAVSLVCLLTIRGYLRGLAGELAQLLSLVIALAAGLFYYSPLAGWLEAHTRLTGSSARAAAFVAVLGAAVAILIVLRHLLARFMKVVFEERFNRLGGLAAGFVRALALVMVVFLVMNLWPHPYLNRQFGEESVIGRFLIGRLPALRSETPPEGDATEIR
jgi:uncharacterized membrane protein required for colicin V production